MYDFNEFFLNLFLLISFVAKTTSIQNKIRAPGEYFTKSCLPNHLPYHVTMPVLPTYGTYCIRFHICPCKISVQLASDKFNYLQVSSSSWHSWGVIKTSIPLFAIACDIANSLIEMYSISISSMYSTKLWPIISE